MSFSQLKVICFRHLQRKYAPTTSPFSLSFLHSSSSRYISTKNFIAASSRLFFQPTCFPSRHALLFGLFFPNRFMTIAKSPQSDESLFLSSQVVSTDELVSMLKNNRTAIDTGDILLIDVRNPEETALGTIPTAISIPLSELKDALALPNMQFKLMYQGEKPSRETGNLVFYCKSGKRSTLACETAKSLGYKKVRNFSGSYDAWLEYQDKLKKTDPSSTASN